MEDVYDILSVRFPHCDSAILIDQSSDHRKKKEDGLDAIQMSVRYGGKKMKMRKTTIKDDPEYPDQCTHRNEDIQHLQFQEGDRGPWYLTDEECIQQKHPVDTGRQRTREKTKLELLEELKIQGFQVRCHYKRDELKKHAQKHNIPLTLTEKIYKYGWMDANKGLLQVLWERGKINVDKKNEYSLQGKEHQKDENGNVLDEFKPYLLQKLMSECTDFKEEKSALEDLFDKLSAKGGNKISLLESPKYHPEVAGEGIELAWGYLKRYFRSLSLEKKRGRKNFENAVKDSVSFVNQGGHANMFTAQARRYMLAYKQLADGGHTQLTYENIERFQRTIKCHRNASDQDKILLTRLWREAMNNRE